MANKYIALVLGKQKEIAGQVTSSGAGDAGKIVALDAGGKLDVTLMPTGVGPQTASIVSSENLAAGALVNIWNDGGTPKVRNADADSPAKEANGFVLAGVTAPAAATVYFNGTISGLSGMVAGDMFLSATAGQATATPPSTTGQIVQVIGRAISATEIAFNPQEGVELA